MTESVSIKFNWIPVLLIILIRIINEKCRPEPSLHLNTLEA